MKQNTILIAMFAIASIVIVNCNKQQSLPPAPSPSASEIGVQIVTAQPVLQQGPPISPPANVNISPWTPSDECLALADEYLNKMTIRQKAGQMSQVAMRYFKDKSDVATYHIGSILGGGSDYPPGELTGESWAAYADEMKAAALKSELKIPLLFGIDAVHGNGKTQNAVVFPHNIGLGCTGDPALVEKIGQVTAKETLGSGIDWAFSPVLAAARDERWGRTYEAFGETPGLAATYGVALTKGLQGSALGSTPVSALACAKHFAGDGATLFGTSHMEAGVLDRGNTLLSNEDFWQLAVSQYIPAIEAGVGSIMISYSAVNGRKMHGEQNLIGNILKGTLGFNGFVVSDWKGIDDNPGNFEQDIIDAINAGIDMVMIPDRYQDFIDVIEQQVPASIPTERIDDAVRRILTVKCEMGMFKDDYSYKTDPALIQSIGNAEHRAIGREAVAKSLVLLKNDGDILPLKTEQRIHITGTGADNLDKQCGGWTITWGGAGSRTEGTTVLEAIKKVVSSNLLSHDQDGSDINDDADVVLVVVGEIPYSEWRGDREWLKLRDDDAATVKRVQESGKPYVVILFSGRPMVLTELIDDADAFVAAWLPGSEGDGIADVLFGQKPFTGKLSHTWPQTHDQLPINDGDGQKPLFPLGFGLTTK